MRIGLLAGVLLVSACAQGAAGGDDDSPGDDDVAPPDAMRDGDGTVIDPPDGSTTPIPDAGVGGLPDADPSVHGWLPVGAPIPTSSSYGGPAIAIDGNGQPVVAITNGSGATAGAETYRLVSETWQLVGTRQSTGGFATVVDVAAFGNHFFMGWPAGGDGNDLRDFAVGASDWTTPAGTPLGQYSTFLPYTNVVTDDAGKAWVAYSEHIPNGMGGNSPEYVFVQQQTGGGTWTKRVPDNGISSALNQDALAPDLVSAGGKMFMAFEGSGVYVRVFNAATNTWDPVGSGQLIPTVPAGVSSPSTCSASADGSGHVWVAYHAYIGGDDGTVGYVARWDGSSWSNVGEAFQGFDGLAEGSATYTTMQDIAVRADGVAFVVWTEENAATNQVGVYVDKCVAGSGCVGVGRQRLDAAGGDAITARIAVDGAGRPVVAWSENDSLAAGTTQQIHVWRYYGDPDN